MLPDMTETNMGSPAFPDPLQHLAPEFLDEVEGEGALAWVRQRNERAVAAAPELRGQLEAEILEILDDPRRIPRATYRNGYAYNFWVDEKHPRGLWRRQPFQDYLEGGDQWDVLLDVDALAAEEGKSWVWQGANVRYPEGDRALINLSDGGTDANETREFDLETRSWVPGGFYRPPAKGTLRWIDLDHCWLTQPMGEGTVSASGYPLQARILKRGQALEDSRLILAGDPEAMLVGAATRTDRSGKHSAITVMQDFYTSKSYYLGTADPADITTDSPHALPVPDSAEVSVWNGWAIVWLRKEWERAEGVFPAGSVLALDVQDLLQDPEAPAHALFTPTANQVVEDMTVTADRLVLTIIKDVVTELRVLDPPTGDDPAWSHLPLTVPDSVTAGDPLLTLAVAAVNAPADNRVWIVATGFTTPQTLWLVDLGERGEQAGDWRLVREAPALFDAQGVTVSQHFATSLDGTRVPYFQVTPQTVLPAPTLLYGYGGFNVSLLPAYSPVAGKAWVERGGVYVIANIRGGGEYGPQWHESALRENRHRAYEDFVAVARDLVARGVTTPSQLGTQGGSNGGLLMGNMYTQYPEDFGAVVCQVPLLDMGRYHTLLAGHSWVAEYGDPEVPEDWRHLSTYSPLHLLHAQQEDSGAAPDYPPLLLTTSTKDDRVHPAHARTFAHLAEETGRDVLYYENIEGGHGGAADNKQRAFMQALAWSFLWDKLTETETG